MSSTLEKITRDAVHLPRHQRLALARFLIELDDPASDPDIETAWDKEIRERVQAVEQGEVEGIPYDQVLARIDQRLA